MEVNHQAIMDFKSRTPARSGEHEPVPRHLTSQAHTLPEFSRGSQLKSTTEVISLGTYSHSSMGTTSRRSHLLSPPISQPDNISAKATYASQQEIINRLRDEKDRLVSDKDRLMTEKDALLNQKLGLIEDKERAIKDGDDLLSSKTKLWHEYYQTVKEKDEEIASLNKLQASMHEELLKQGKKNRRLARALAEYMEMRDEDADVDEGTGATDRACKIKPEPVLQREPVPRAEKRKRTSSWLESVSNADERPTESRKQLQETFGGEFDPSAAEHYAAHPKRPAKRARIAGKTVARDGSPGQAMSLPSHCTDITRVFGESQQTICSRPDTPPPASGSRVRFDLENTGKVECIQAASHQVQLPKDTAAQGDHRASVQTSGTLSELNADLLVPMSFTLRPVIRQKAASGGYGQLGELDECVLKSLCHVLYVLRDRNKPGKHTLSPMSKSTAGCCWTWMHGSGHECRWTRSQPKLYACRSCFQHDRACIVWQGGGVWDVLPLPPRVRSENARYGDPGYYIYGKRVCWANFPDVWEKQKTSSAKG